MLGFARRFKAFRVKVPILFGFPIRTPLGIFFAPSIPQVRAVRRDLTRKKLAWYRTLLVEGGFDRGLGLDVGANIGHTTVLFSLATESRMTIFAVEPNMRNLPFLVKNFRRVRNVYLLSIGISDTKSAVRLALPDFNTKHSRIERRNTGLLATSPVTLGQGGVAAESWTIPSDLLVEITDGGTADRPTPISFVKVDIEGSEIQFFRAAGAVFDQRAAIELEVNPLFDATGLLTEIGDLVVAHNYKLFGAIGTSIARGPVELFLLPREKAGIAGRLQLVEKSVGELLAELHGLS